MNIVITGANRGIGLALASRFAARADATVFALSRELAGATDLQALTARSAGRVHPVALDVSDPQAIEKLDATLGVDAVHLLVNNAGLNEDHEFGEITAADLSRLFAVNVFAPLLVTQRLRTRLRTGSKVVNITSVLGSIARADTGYLAYGMSKAALNMLSKKLALELEPAGVAVLALHPGWVQTRMGGEGATLDIDTAANAIVAVIDGFTLARTGAYLAYDGSELPW